MSLLRGCAVDGRSLHSRKLSQQHLLFWRSRQTMLCWFHWLNHLYFIIYLYQDLVHFSPGFTHTPPVGLSITYTSPPVSRPLWGQEWGADVSLARGEEWRQAEWLFTFFWKRTTEPGVEHASVFWNMSIAPSRWKITRASMEDLEPCCPMLFVTSRRFLKTIWGSWGKQIRSVVSLLVSEPETRTSDASSTRADLPYKVPNQNKRGWIVPVKLTCDAVDFFIVIRQHRS